MIICRSVASAARKGMLSKTGCVVTIGNFDGVHLGHQAMLAAAKKQANKLGVPLLVLSFDPHPAAYFLPDIIHQRINSFGERVLSLSNAGVDIACIVPFNTALAALSHEAFSDNILARQLNAKCVVIGDDFQYGKGRSGDVISLRASGIKLGFESQKLDSVINNHHRVSSTIIRQMLNKGDLDAVAQDLGRPYFITGRVTHGDARGREWGFPTLNIPLRAQRALNGVFAVKVNGLGDDSAIEGVANLGKRPTVDGLKYLLEVHLFDYNSDAYGKRVCVTFYKQIRREQKFASFDELKSQIRLDIKVAKQFFQTKINT